MGIFDELLIYTVFERLKRKPIIITQLLFALWLDIIFVYLLISVEKKNVLYPEIPEIYNMLFISLIVLAISIIFYVSIWEKIIESMKNDFPTMLNNILSEYPLNDPEKLRELLKMTFSDVIKKGRLEQSRILSLLGIVSTYYMCLMSAIFVADITLEIVLNYSIIYTLSSYPVLMAVPLLLTVIMSQLLNPFSDLSIDVRNTSSNELSSYLYETIVNFLGYKQSKSGYFFLKKILITLFAVPYFISSRIIYTKTIRLPYNNQIKDSLDKKLIKKSASMCSGTYVLVPLGKTEKQKMKLSSFLSLRKTNIYSIYYCREESKEPKIIGHAFVFFLTKMPSNVVMHKLTECIIKVQDIIIKKCQNLGRRIVSDIEALYSENEGEIIIMFIGSTELIGFVGYLGDMLP